MKGRGRRVSVHLKRAPDENVHPSSFEPLRLDPIRLSITPNVAAGNLSVFAGDRVIAAARLDFITLLRA